MASGNRDELVWQGHPSWRGMVPWLAKGLAISLLVSGVLHGRSGPGHRELLAADQAHRGLRIDAQAAPQELQRQRE